MKYLKLFILFLVSRTILAQEAEVKIPHLYVNDQVTTHIIFSEPITYTDISSKSIVGDQPAPNILRIKPIPFDSLKRRGIDYSGIVTVVGQKYFAQYELIYSSPDQATKNIRVESTNGIGLMNPEVTMSNDEMKEFCLNVLKKKQTYYNVKSKSSRVSAHLNNLYTIGDYFFIDVTYYNHTKIKYSIDQIRFKIEDKKKVKRTNFQQVEIKPEYTLYDIPEFNRRHRNVYVFKKFTFPNEKVFTIELAEEQISGRTVMLEISYSDVLNADTL